MTNFFEELKIRHAEAQKRLQAAQQEAQAVQTRFQAIAQEFNSLQLLLNVEAAKEENKPSEDKTAQAAIPNANRVIIRTVGMVPQAASVQTALPLVAENKTEMIRELLRQYPGGITPTELWKQVKTRMTHRAYLYSILKRLKDKGEVMIRRGKYIAKIMPKHEEEKEQPVLQ
jgi:hypothetical protein